MSATLKTTSANTLHMRYAEAGPMDHGGPLVLFCHGWPESWYSWRHQLAAVSAAGFRCVAPDMRGYGGTEAPEPIEHYTLHHLVGDMAELVKALGETQAVIVGHDWGAPVAWHAALFRPDIFTAVAGLSVPPPFRGRGKPLDLLLSPGTAAVGSQGFMGTFATGFMNQSGTAELRGDPPTQATPEPSALTRACSRRRLRERDHHQSRYPGVPQRARHVCECQR